VSCSYSGPDSTTVIKPRAHLCCRRLLGIGQGGTSDVVEAVVVVVVVVVVMVVVEVGAVVVVVVVVVVVPVIVQELAHLCCGRPHVIGQGGTTEVDADKFENIWGNLGNFR
jgi:hypothetical protein